MFKRLKTGLEPHGFGREYDSDLRTSLLHLILGISKLKSANFAPKNRFFVGCFFFVCSSLVGTGIKEKCPHPKLNLLKAPQHLLKSGPEDAPGRPGAAPGVPGAAPVVQR